MAEEVVELIDDEHRRLAAQLLDVEEQPHEVAGFLLDRGKVIVIELAEVAEQPTGQAGLARMAIKGHASALGA